MPDLNRLRELNRRGMEAHQRGEYVEAMRLYQKAMAVSSAHPDVVCNYACTLNAVGKTTEAIRVFRMLLKQEPDNPKVHYNLSWPLLMEGRLEEGFREYAWRWKTGKMALSEEKLWHGEPLEGGTLVVAGEQGLGDVIHFLRYLPMARVASGVDRIILICTPALHRFLDGNTDADEVVSPQMPLPPFERHVPLLNLPALLGTRSEAEIPADVPYLRADPKRVDFWRKRLGRGQERQDRSREVRVGLIWQGNLKTDPLRSLSLADYAPLGEVPGVSFLALQKGGGEEQLKTPPPGMMIRTPGEDFDPGPDLLVDTAAVMELVDLVITPDTSVAHLAGALGRPTWTFLKVVPDWRWQRDRRDCPWYPTMRLFRQSALGWWADVAAEAAERLHKVQKGEIDLP